MRTESNLLNPHGVPLQVMNASPPRNLRPRSVKSVSHEHPNKSRENFPKQKQGTQTATYLLPSLAFPQLETQLRISEAQPNLTSDHHTPSSQSASQPVRALDANKAKTTNQSNKPTVVKSAVAAKQQHRQNPRLKIQRSRRSHPF